MVLSGKLDVEPTDWVLSLGTCLTRTCCKNHQTQISIQMMDIQAIADCILIQWHILPILLQIYKTGTRKQPQETFIM